MKKVNRNLGILVFLLFEACFAVVHSGDIGDDVRGAVTSSETKNGGFLEIGVSAAISRPIRHDLDPDSNDARILLNMGLSISAGYRYKRMFIEASESGFDGLNMGVTLFDSNRWNVDLLLANINGNITVESDEPPPPTTESERNQAILDRDSLSVAAGARLTGYFGDNIFQMRLVSDWYDGNGLQGSARIGRQWQVGNWNAQAIAGVRYNSSEFNNYVFGVSAEEESQRFSQYTASRAWIPEIELGASLPVKENWVYSTRLRYRTFPSSVTNSPLVANNNAVILTTGIHYVF